MRHYVFGGSTATRTLNCAAWVGLSEDIPKGPASAAAQLGTMLHTVSEKCVNDFEYNPVIGDTVDGIELTATHVAEKINPAIDAVAELEEKYDVEFQTEVQMSISDDTGGTADLIAMNQEKNIFIGGDFKFGDGHMVQAKDNDQLLFYTMLAAIHFKDSGFDFNNDTKFIGAIIQPSERRDEVLDVWEFTMERLEAFTKQFATARKLATGARETIPTPGAHCQWCPAEAICPAKTGLVQQSRRLAADSDNLADLNDAMQLVDEMESWARAVRKLAHEQAEEGVKITGHKLVAKRATRQWNEPVAVEAKTKAMRSLKAEDYFEQKLKSPAQMEKTCKQKKVDFKQFSQYIVSISSGNSLVPESDKRPAIVPVKALAATLARIT